MNKKITILFALCITTVHPKDIILWDLHNVVLTRSWSDTARVLLGNTMAQSLANLSWDQFKDIISLSLNNLTKETSSEDYLHLAKKYNNPALAKLIVQVGNAQEFMPGIRSIIDELDLLGFEQHVGSNIGKTAYDQLIQNPTFIPVMHHMNQKKSQVVHYDPYKIIKKPDPVFFQHYLAKNKLDPKTTRIIFIDDKKENVKTAQKIGFEGIHFRDSQQLRNELNKRGIAIAPPRYKQRRFEAYKQLFK